MDDFFCTLNSRITEVNVGEGVGVAHISEIYRIPMNLHDMNRYLVLNAKQLNTQTNQVPVVYLGIILIHHRLQMI